MNRRSLFASLAALCAFPAVVKVAPKAWVTWIDWGNLNGRRLAEESAYIELVSQRLAAEMLYGGDDKPWFNLGLYGSSHPE